MLVMSLLSLIPERWEWFVAVTREEMLERLGVTMDPSDPVFLHHSKPEPKPKPDSRERANAADVAEKLRRGSRQRIEQLENVKAWAEHYGALCLAAHDRAARFAEQRDAALLLVEQLEIGKI